MSSIAFDGETYVVTENGRPIVKDQIMVLPINHRTDPIASDFRLIRYLAQNGFKNLNCLPVGQHPELVTTDQGDLLAPYSDPFALYLNATAGSGRSIAHVHPNGFPADYVPLPSAEKAPWEVCQDAQTGAVISRFEMGFYALVIEGADPEGIAKTLERFHQAMIEWKMPYNLIAFPFKKQGSESPVVRMVVVPASTQIWNQALKEGLFDIFTQAGATVSTPTCGACLGGHMGVLADGEVCITSTNRNFKGRMGHPGAMPYLASPATVAASAIAGHIADPRDHL